MKEPMTSTALEFENLTSKPVVLCIAGSDSAGMAGIQQDIRTLTAFHVHPCCAITANTAQNNHRVMAIHAVPLDVLTSQIEATQDIKTSAIKIGLLCSTEQVRVVCDSFHADHAPIVFDPVLSASSGQSFSNNDFIQACKIHLIPRCTLITPNRHEAEALVGFALNNQEDIIAAAKTLLDMGANAVLIKGGHADQHVQSSNQNAENTCSDYFCDSQRQFWLSNQRLDSSHTRGTGCALASSIAAALARGYGLYDAVVIGKMAIQQGLRHARAVADKQGAIEIMHFPNAPEDLPQLTHDLIKPQPAFPACSIPIYVNPSSTKSSSSKPADIFSPPLGIYPVVDSADWIERLLTLGVSTIQLRAKHLDGDALEAEIELAIKIARRYQARLFINDHWQLAIKHGAYGVHLGQEDLDGADINAIHDAGLRLGVSTHSFYETARAHALKPSYIAIGPVFATTSKHMPWIPRGLEGLSYWQHVLTNYPIVAIGGINYSRAQAINHLGINGIAMISAITEAEDPDEVTKKLLALFKIIRDDREQR